jgi:hypothetical protein
MQWRYTLPISAILQTLTCQNGITALTAPLPFVPGYQQETGKVVLILGQGRIQTCTIRSRDGLLLLQGGEALKALEQFGNLEWSVQGFRDSGQAGQTAGSTGQDPAWPQQEQVADQSIPHRRIAALSPEQQQTLSRRHRHVFALADGVHSVASIATLLHLSSEEVARLLYELHQDQLID